MPETKIDFLEATYDNLSFLINRNQFFTSAYPNNLISLKDNDAHLTSLMEYDSAILYVFDLDILIKDIFQCTSESPKSLVLIVNTDIFSEATKKLLKKIKFNAEKTVSTQFIALKMISKVEIKSIVLSELKLLPNCIKDVLVQNGILGCRFLRIKYVQYYIDIESLLYNAIKRTTKKKMKILIVDDSAVIRSILKQILENDKSITIVGEASNGKKAVDMAEELNPDLIIMDLNMPVLNGIEATQQIMKKSPTPILIFSGEVDAHSGFDAIQKGAVEILKKPDFHDINEPEFVNSFIQRIKELEKVHSATTKKKYSAQKACEDDNASYKICLIGASTGGPVAIKKILTDLPADFPLGIAIVQHLEKGFEEGYTEWLNDQSKLTVRLAKINDMPKPGEVIVSPVDVHLVLNGNSFTYNDGPPVLNQKPSVDILFKSAAKSYGNKVLAVLLTGMGKDGGEGCVAIKEKCGFTVVQDEETSTIFGMPQAAIELGGASVVLPLNEIAEFLVKRTEGSR